MSRLYPYSSSHDAAASMLSRCRTSSQAFALELDGHAKDAFSRKAACDAAFYMDRAINSGLRGPRLKMATNLRRDYALGAAEQSWQALQHGAMTLAERWCMAQDLRVYIKLSRAFSEPGKLSFDLPAFNRFYNELRSEMHCRPS